MLKKLLICIICMSLIIPFFSFGMFKTPLLRACANSGAFRQTSSKLFRSTAPSLMTLQEACKVLRLKGNESEVEIKIAYRKAALLAHPDVAGGSNEKMKLLNEARRVVEEHYKIFGSSCDKCKYSRQDQSIWKDAASIFQDTSIWQDPSIWSAAAAQNRHADAQFRSADAAQNRNADMNADVEFRTVEFYESYAAAPKRPAEFDESYYKYDKKTGNTFWNVYIKFIIAGIVLKAAAVVYKTKKYKSLQIEKNWFGSKPLCETVWNEIENKSNHFVNRQNYTYEIIDDGKYWKVVFSKK